MNEKHINLILIILIIVSCLILTNSVKELINPKPPKVIHNTEYIKGKTVYDTTYVDRVVEVKSSEVVKADKVTDDPVHYAKTDFQLGKDSTNVSGTVEYTSKDSVFTFSDVIIRYPEMIQNITRVDTVLTETTIIETPPFYADHWFWSFLVTLGVLILSLTNGAIL